MPVSLLRTVSFLYGLGVRFRLLLYRKGVFPTRRLPLKVISIGNLTVGGTGKTPHAALLARYLQEKGIKTAVLSRGYRGSRMKAGAVISDGQSLLGTLEEGGEEPFWLAQKLSGIPVVIGKDRYRSGLLCQERWQTEWVVLDDGFQHLGLKREINILLWPSYLSFHSGRLLPSGLLREPIEEMRRADTILVTHAEELAPSRMEEIAKEIRSRVPGAPVFFSVHKPLVLWRYPRGEEIGFGELINHSVVAFCGLAYPESLRLSLKQLQADPVRLVEFPDHHFYRDKDKRDLETLCRSSKIDIMVTTEKDALKLGPWNPTDIRILVLKIDVEIRDPAFWEWLDQRIRREV
jgi:tetraacyldisaccharide 4'-kinase